MGRFHMFLVAIFFFSFFGKDSFNEKPSIDDFEGALQKSHTFPLNTKRYVG